MPLSVCFLAAMYRNAESVRGFAAHVRSLPGADRLDVVVADNSNEGDIANAIVFHPGRNLGYVPGCAWALSRWLEQAALPTWICVTNTDLRLADDFLVRLAQMAVGDETGIVAPDVRLRSGAQQNPILHRRPPRVMMHAYAALSRLALFMPIFELSVRLRHALRRTGVATEGEIYAAHGSIFLIHRRFFERGGTLQYRGTMYGEEIHVAEQARRAGLRVILRPELRVEHDEHATTRSVPSLQRRLWHAESAGVLWNDYFVERAER
jgi:GT2 family glycosyltransferase